MIGAPTEEEQFEKHRKDEQFVQQRLALIDREGVALTPLRPVGVVEIDGHRHDAVTETDFVPVGAKIRITHVEPTQVRCRPLA